MAWKIIKEKEKKLRLKTKGNQFSDACLVLFFCIFLEAGLDVQNLTLIISNWVLNCAIFLVD